MKVAIVGATGFLGSSFVRYARMSRLDLKILALHRSGHVAPASTNITPMEFDLDEPAPSAIDTDVAIYCAGVSDHGLGFGRIADSAARLARFLDGFRGRLILLSSGAVYYNGGKGPVSESAPIAPMMPYGIAKHLEEQVAFGAAASGRLRGLAVLRLFYAFGPGERPTRLIRRAIGLAQTGGGEIEIPEGAPSVIHPVHVDELAQWIFDILDTPSAGIETLNLAGAAAMPLDRAVAEIAAATKTDLRVKRTPRAEAFPVHYWSDASRQHARGLIPASFATSVAAYAAGLTSRISD